MTPLQVAPFKTLSLGSFFERFDRSEKARAGLFLGPAPGSFELDYFLMPNAAYWSGM